MLELSHISFSYDNALDKKALSDVTLSIDDGECIALCGASGCGKSTLIKVLNGMIPHFVNGILQGTALLDQKLIKDYNITELASKTGTVFQNPKTQFFNTDTDSEITFGIENLGLTLGEMRKRYDRTVTECEIEDLLGLDIFKLSGGEKQRIAFASIYAMDQDIYLLDEPSSNLDGESIEKIRNLVCKLKQSGKTIIIAEHRLYYLTGLVDKYIYMKNGTICEIYSKGQFLQLTDDMRKKMGLRSIYVPAKKIPMLAYDENIEQEAILSVHDLTFCYHRKKTILQNIDFSIQSGTITAVCGRNGAGKSTLFDILCGLLKEKSGTIQVNGKTVSPKKRQKIFGLVMQNVNSQLFADSVLAECMVGNINISEEQIIPILKELSLDHHIEDHPIALSGGEKQRTAISSILVADREIILMDEPTSGLDYFHMIKLGDLLRGLTRKGKTILVITHDIEFINSACDTYLNIG